MTQKSPFDNPGEQWPKLDVRVTPYDPAWPERFLLESALLQNTLGGAAHSIEHFGSTSVPGLSAKPIVDIVVELTRSLGPEDRAGLRASGFTHERRVDDPNITFLGKGMHEVHLQLVPCGHPSVVPKLAVRDFLRAHPAEARAYGLMKLEIAASVHGVARDYAFGKRAYVDALEARALAWYRTERRP